VIPEGNPLKYSWSFASLPPGSSAALDDPASATPKFIPDLPGPYVLSLVVNDGELDSQPATIMLMAIEAGKDKSGEKKGPGVMPIGQGKTKVRANEEAELESISRKIKLKMPKGAVSEEVEVQITEHGQWGSRESGLLNVFELNASATGRDNAKVKNFQKQLQLTGIQ